MKQILILGVVLAGCGAGQKDSETLSESIRSYNEGIRWQRYGVAAVRIMPRDRSRFVEDMDKRGEDLKITDYEIVNVDTKGEKAARVQVKISWYRDAEGVLHDTTAIQSWEKHGKAWFMVDEARTRGTEMPGMTSSGDAP